MMKLDLPSGPFSGYIFDCDGTLADSMPMHFEAWSQAFQRHNAQFDFTWELFYSLAGTGTLHSVEQLNKRFGDNLVPEAVAESQSEIIHQLLEKLEPIPEVVALAQRYAEAGYPISVASGGTRPHVHKTLEIIGVAEIFPVVVTQEDIVNSKPAPDIFLLAAEKMGVPPHECLVFEDSLLGIEAADRAKMQSVYIDPTQ